MARIGTPAASAAARSRRFEPPERARGLAGAAPTTAVATGAAVSGGGAHVAPASPAAVVSCATTVACERALSLAPPGDMAAGLGVPCVGLAGPERE